MKQWKKYAAAAMIAASLAAAPMVSIEAAHLEDIAARGTIRIGTTGDYRPMSYLNKETGEYEGFDAALAQAIADSLHVKVEFVPTTWPTLSADTEAGKFDIAICGITRTFDRARTLEMSDGYLLFGKTILCRDGDAAKYQSIADMNRPEVRVMVNPGGTNEKFARENLPNATIIVHEHNAEIPGLIADGAADIMITETMEAIRYERMDSRLAAPLAKTPFTKNRFGILMAKGDQELLNYINFVLAELTMNGTMEEMEHTYIN